MINLKIVLKDRVNLFVFLVFMINIIGGIFVYRNYMSKKINFPKGNALDVRLKSSSQKIKITKNIDNDNQVHKVYFTVFLTNNTDRTITGIKLIMPNINVNFLETPTAIRFTHLLPVQNEIVFSLQNLSPLGNSRSVIVGYITEPGNYTIKANIETDQKIRAASNIIILEAE